MPFIPDQVYHRRNDIHAIYGGNWQSGICPSISYPYIFIFSGKSGHQHGYQDGWDNPNVFSYTGEGQSGDMTFSRGNLALRDHKENGKRVFLFESHSKGYVKFVSEVELIEEDYFLTHDTAGNNRMGIKFFFKRTGAYIPYKSESVKMQSEVAEPPQYLQTEQQRFINSRVGQGAYRKRIIHRWEYKCAVTGFDKLSVLIASHILPWSSAEDNERLDVHNGILLSPTYDALFDKKLISFENSGRIILSDSIESLAYSRVGVTGKERINNFSTYNLNYLEKHRLSFFEK